MKIYIYPTYTPSRDKSGNKYIKYFHDAFKRDGHSCICNRLWQVGIASIFLNLDAKVFIIQWVDLIPFKRFGKIQFVIYLLAIWLLHILDRKIVWILHNKHAHNGKSKLVDYGMSIMARYSSVVVTHSNDGVLFFNSCYPKYQGKCHVIPHPVYTSEIIPSSEIEWDYIIWGSISKRKRVAEFLSYAKKSSFFSNKKIVVCGNCGDSEYDKQIRDAMGGNVLYINKFISDEDLCHFISKSKIILFTYNTDSLLSSGALIYSLNFCKPIIGPDSGNFADMTGIVSCYNNFSDIPNLEVPENKKLVAEYIEENSWDTFSGKVYKILSSV